MCLGEIYRLLYRSDWILRTISFVSDFLRLKSALLTVRVQDLQALFLQYPELHYVPFPQLRGEPPLN